MAQGCRRAFGALASLAGARGRNGRAEAGGFRALERRHDVQRRTRRNRGTRRENVSGHSALENSPGSASSALNVVVSVASALRRCRQPVPARVAVVDGRPVRVTTDRRGFTGGAVTHCAGPWRTSGEWWAGEAGGAGGAGRSNGVGRSGGSNGETSVSSTHPTYPPHQSHQAPWNRDEWDLSLGDGAVYRVFRDRDANSWFIDAIVD